ncbi:hypothetical protein GmHk_U059468 [Glycine max]|nr:hypothetical protein GmHk_U059468 [Glycine max]
MVPKSTLRLMRTLGPSVASLAQSTWSLLSNALVGTLWAQRASTVKRSFSALSVIRESRRAQGSRLSAKREISSLSKTLVSCQAQHTIGAKPKSTNSR